MRQVLATPLGHFVDHVLRGVGQVMLQNNPITGLLFLIGIFINDWLGGIYAILGTAVATATAMLFEASTEEISGGLHGFNGALVGLALEVYLPHGPPLVAFVIVAAMFTTIVTAAIKRIADPGGRPITGPFVLTTWIFIGSLLAYSRVANAEWLGSLQAPTYAEVPLGPISPGDALLGILNGAGQVMFQQNPWTGAIFLVAIAINSRVSCLAAVLGSALGGAVGWFLGGSPDALRNGLFGFNGVLTAIALGGIFFLLRRTTILLTILAVCVSTVLYGSFVVILYPLSLPVLTAPFVITTWLCLLACAHLPRLAALYALVPSTPEGNLRAARSALPEKK